MNEATWYLGADLRMPNSDAHVVRQYKPGKALDGNMDLVELAVERLDIAPFCRKGWHALKQGVRVKSDHLVKTYQWPSSKPLDYLSNYYTLVSARFRNVVEALEPLVHQFEPVQLVGTKHAPFDRRWVMIIGNRIDCVDEGATIGFVRPDGPHSWSGSWRYDDKTEGAQLAFSRAKTAGRHLWVVGDMLINDTPLISDRLKRALEAEGLTGMTFTRARSV